QYPAGRSKSVLCLHNGPVSVPVQRQQNLDQDEQDDDELQEFHAVCVGLVRDDLIDPLGHLQFSLDTLFPFLQVEAGAHQAVDTGQILVADELEGVAGPLEQPVGFNLQLAQGAQRLAVAAPERQPGLGQRMNRSVSRRQVVIEPVVDVAEFQQLKIGELNRL